MHLPRHARKAFAAGAIIAAACTPTNPTAPTVNEAVVFGSRGAVTAFAPRDHVAAFQVVAIPTWEITGLR